MKKLFLLLFLTILLNNVFAQHLELSGVVVEKSSREPLPRASVLLYSIDDSSLVKGTTTATSGAFTITDLSEGYYFLVSSFVGFINDTIPNIALTENLNLDTIKLQASSLLLDEVSVSANKPLITHDLEKEVYHVDRDIMAEGRTVTEILQNIPSVTVDINGNITLRHTSNITFFINGKPSALLRRNPTAVLKQFPAGSIKRIEVITNPSAKYRPDGAGGIINIVLKKDTEKEGLNGQISANAGNEQRYNANINLNYSKNDFKLFGNYGLRHSNRTILFNDKRRYKDSITDAVKSIYNEAGHSKANAFSHNIFAGMNYDLNDQNSLELSGSYFNRNSYHKGSSDINEQNSTGTMLYQYKNNETNDEFEEEGELNFSYEHIFNNNEDHSLNFEVTYSAYDEREDQTYREIYFIPADQSDTSSYLVQKGGHQAEIAADYTLPIGEDAEVNTGYSGEFIFDDIRYNDYVEKNKFLFNQQLHGLYAIFKKSIHHFSFQPGLRAEQTLIQSHLVVPSDSLIPNNYFKLYPTLHLGYDLNDNQKISLSYSKRVNRPDADQLNPNPEYIDPRNAEAGNPDLKPEQIHSFEMGYQSDNDHFSLTASLYYRYKYDAFTTIYNNVGDSVVIFTTTNLSSQQLGGLEGTLSGNLFDFWDYKLTGDVYYTTINATNLGYTDKSSISGSAKGYSLFQVTENTSIQMNAYYYFPRITPQGRREPFYYFNLGIKQDLFKDRASITITGTDVFHTYKSKRTIDSKVLNQHTSYRRKHPVVYIGFTWRFNNYKEEDKINFENIE